MSIILAIRVQSARLIRSDAPNSPTGELVIEASVTNEGPDHRAASQRDLRFELLDSQGQPVALVHSALPASQADEMELTPGDSLTYSLRAFLFGGEPQPEQPYRLRCTAHDATAWAAVALQASEGRGRE